MVIIGLHICIWIQVVISAHVSVVIRLHVFVVTISLHLSVVISQCIYSYYYSISL